MESISYVYVYLDPSSPGEFKYMSKSKDMIYEFNHKPFYVGKGRNSRMYDHLNNSSIIENYAKHRTIRKLVNLFGKSTVKSFVIKFADNLSNEAAFALEIDMIMSIGRLIDGGPLTNILVDSNLPPDNTGVIRDTAYCEKMPRTRRGANNPNALLTDSQAKDIFFDPRTIPVIAKEYSVAQGRVRDIKLGLYYADATGFNEGKLPKLPINSKYLDPRYITCDEILDIKNLIEIKNYTYKQVQVVHNYSLDFLLKLKKLSYANRTYKNRDRYKLLSYNR